MPYCALVFYRVVRSKHEQPLLPQIFESAEAQLGAGLCPSVSELVDLQFLFVDFEPRELVPKPIPGLAFGFR